MKIGQQEVENRVIPSLITIEKGIHVPFNKLIFNLPTQPGDLTAFRGAIAHKAGLDQDLFHNHKNSGLHHRYPLIQYQLQKGLASIIGIGKGAEALSHFVHNFDQELKIQNNFIPVKILNFIEREEPISFSDKPRTYKIENWLAFNLDNFGAWKKLSGGPLIPKVEFIQRILTGHILSLISGIGWKAPDHITVALHRIDKQKWITARKMQFLALDIYFEMNLEIPTGIGLGKASSLGFGRLAKRER